MSGTPTPPSTTKLAVGWSAVVLAIVTGLGGAMKWIATDVATPVTARLIKNYDFQEENAAKLTEAFDGLKAETHGLRGDIGSLKEAYKTVGSASLPPR